jgi:hypothetical protein
MQTGEFMMERIEYKELLVSVCGVFLEGAVAESHCPAVNGDVNYNEYVEEDLNNEGGNHISIF